MIKLHNITKSFNDDLVLSDFSFHFYPNEKYLIIGESGIGKTTLLNIIMGLQKPDEGFVDCFCTFSCSFQQTRLLEKYTVIENLKIISNKENLEEIISHLLGQEFIHKPVYSLSGGQKQKVSIIRALISNSDCVILDEPFNGLDERNIELCINYILDNLKGRTLIISSHITQQLKPHKFITINL
ncbi:MAG: ABC transporter ATP-binding protein [Erysipelotrichaceae bacterium]|jgi:NitT/TauT family transport system ATP-binding protein